MHVFGDIWQNHAERIAANWDAVVKPEDTVLVCGDHSWAIKFEDAAADLDYIAARPGSKILIRGNHDYWWRRESTNRIQSQLPESMRLLHGRGLVIEGVGVAGTRGWRVEFDQDLDAGDEKVMKRELMYLERGLSEIPAEVESRIVMLHYPPFDADLEPNAFAQILRSHKVDILVYGHIHGGFKMEGDVDGIDYRLVSVDHTGFAPVRIV